MALALQIVRFSEMLEDMLDDLLPNRITDYVYVLSDLFSNFYTECKARAATVSHPGRAGTFYLSATRAMPAESTIHIYRNACPIGC